MPECYTYIRDAILAILDEYPIAYIKWDHNRDLIDAGTSPDGRPGVHAQTQAFYRLLDELKAAHAGLEIESCSSGGARVDLGVLERSDRIWVSDCIDPLERQQMNRWTTQLVPPEMLGSHIASGRSHTTGRVHDLSFRAGTAVFGHLGIEWDLATATVDELKELGSWVQFFRQNRGLLLSGDLVRGDLPDDSAMLHGVLAPDRSHALFAYAAVSRSDVVSLGRLRLPGLDQERRYRVAPVLVGRPPSGLRPPAWWRTVPVPVHPELEYAEHQDLIWPRDADGDEVGVVLSGAILTLSGLMAPQIDPDQVVLFSATAVD
jgi:alpha-galactosidase